MCNYHIKDISHLVFQCPFTKDVVFSLHQSSDWMSIPFVEGTQSACDIISSLRSFYSKDQNL